MISSKDKVILVSGANRGIGKAVASALYHAGYNLSLGVRQPENAQELVSGWDSDRFAVHRYDAEDYSTHQSWVTETAAQFGHIDGLVNNAGIAVRVTVEQENDQALDKMWAVNVKAPLSMIRRCLPYLRQSGEGRIVNVASIAGKAVHNNNVGYAMSKFAVVALSHATRHAGWEDGVRCTALCPSFVRTDMTADVETFPIDAMMEPEDIAQLVVTTMSLSNSASVAELIVNCRKNIML